MITQIEECAVKLFENTEVKVVSVCVKYFSGKSESHVLSKPSVVSEVVLRNLTAKPTKRKSENIRKLG